MLHGYNIRKDEDFIRRRRQRYELAAPEGRFFKKPGIFRFFLEVRPSAINLPGPFWPRKTMDLCTPTSEQTS